MNCCKNIARETICMMNRKDCKSSSGSSFGIMGNCIAEKIFMCQHNAFAFSRSTGSKQNSHRLSEEISDLKGPALFLCSISSKETISPCCDSFCNEIISLIFGQRLRISAVLSKTLALSKKMTSESERFSSSAKSSANYPD